MNKLLDTMEKSSISFSFYVEDLAAYKLILEMQTENLDKFLNIVPINWAFHRQMS